MLYIGTLCACVVASLFVVSHSLWFLRGMLGEGPSVFEVGYALLDTTSETIVVRASMTANKYLGISLLDYSRFVFMQAESREYVVGIPRLSHQLHAGKDLRDHGWNVSRHLWILVASRDVKNLDGITVDSEDRRGRIIDGLKREVVAIFLNRLPVSPLFIASIIPGVGSIATGVGMYSELTQGIIHAHIQYDGNQLRGVNWKGVQGINEGDGVQFVALSSDKLRFLESKINKEVQATITKKLQFRKTTPDILFALPEGSDVGFFENSDGFAMSVKGDVEEFTRRVVGLLQSEQGARHPTKKGFLLPDGTVGHEYVPSSPSIQFVPDEDIPGCEKSVGYDDQFFMCKKGEIVSVSISKQVALSALLRVRENKGEWGGQILGDELKKIVPELELQALIFSGNDTAVDIVIKSVEQ